MPARIWVEVERLGGFAGFGGPGSPLRSVGRVALDSLSAAERGALDALLSEPLAVDPRQADGFRYRITRPGTRGATVVELPESVVPAVLRDCVRDELR